MYFLKIRAGNSPSSAKFLSFDQIHSWTAAPTNKKWMTVFVKTEKKYRYLVVVRPGGPSMLEMAEIEIY